MLADARTGILVHPYDVGVGISQILPVVVGAIYRSEGTGAGAFVTIEQPELHVHPKLQVALADLFLEQSTQASLSTHQFLLETHSEHLMLRFMRRDPETAVGEPAEDDEDRVPLRPDHVGVVYVQRDENGQVQVMPLRIDERGEFLDVWPEGFFDERVKDLFS